MSEEEKKGPGRKPLPDGEVKVRIDIFIKESIVEANGGEKQLKNNIYYFLGQK